MKKLSYCIVCKGKKFTRLYETHDRMFDIQGNFVVKKCDQCGLIFIDPKPSQEILKKYYPSSQYYSYQGENEKGFFYVLRSYLVRHYYNPTFLSRIFSILVQNVPALPEKRSGKILDVGCGTGDTLALLKELGWDVYGLEIDKNAVAIAQKRGLRNVKLGTCEGIETYPDNYFDAIRLYHVIEHLPNPWLCLKLIRKKLKPGGELILGTPNCHSVTAKLFGKFWYNLDIPRHLFIFSPSALSKLIITQGFIDVRVEFCSAGGIVGSILYTLNHLEKKKRNPNNFLWLFFLLYPLEWLFDKVRIGDIMILRSTKVSTSPGREIK